MQRLLDWKAAGEDRARSELGRVRGLVNREFGRKEAFLEEDRRVREELRSRLAELTAQEFVEYDRYRRTLKDLVGKQDMVLEALREEERKAAERYWAARREREMLEALKAALKARHDREERRREERVLNDIGISMTVRRADVGGEG